MAADRKTTIISELRVKAGVGTFGISQHATVQMIVRDVGVQEVCEAAETSEYTVGYSDNRYGSSCLVSNGNSGESHWGSVAQT